jgi:hypothetical protein
LGQGRLDALDQMRTACEKAANCRNFVMGAAGFEPATSRV